MAAATAGTSMLEDFYLNACKAAEGQAPRPPVVSVLRGRRATGSSDEGETVVPALDLTGTHHTRFRNRIKDADV